MQLSKRAWRTALGIEEHELPELVILEGSWWQRERNALRLGALDGVRELNFPEVYWGRHRDINVVYSCVYGAPRAVEPVHAFASICSPLVIQIGSCGALQPGLESGDIVLPETAVIGEGASQYYLPDKVQTQANSALLQGARAAFESRGLKTHQGKHLTTSALFAQPKERVTAWRDEGYLAVDMETSAVFTVADYFGLPAVALLFVWDELLKGRTFLDAYSPEETKRQQKANVAIFEVALELAGLL